MYARALLREMQHAAADQLSVVEKAAASGQRWMVQREEKREWLRLLVRAWREVVECEHRVVARRPERWRVRHEQPGVSGVTRPPQGPRMQKLLQLSASYDGCSGGSKVAGTSYFWMVRTRGVRPTRITNDVYFRRLREKLRALATWVRLMRKDRERERRRRTARARWVRAINHVRQQAREARDRRPAAHEPDGGSRPEEGRGAARATPKTTGSYCEARAWVRREAPKESTRRMATKEAARVGIRLWWWLVQGGGCGEGPMGVRQPTRGRDG